jgi:hypothetical protein
MKSDGKQTIMMVPVRVGVRARMCGLRGGACGVGVGERSVRLGKEGRKVGREGKEGRAKRKGGWGGGSETRAREAKESMMRFTQSIWMAVRGLCVSTAAPTHATTIAVMLTVNCPPHAPPHITIHFSTTDTADTACLSPPSLLPSPSRAAWWFFFSDTSSKAVMSAAF